MQYSIHYIQADALRKDAKSSQRNRFHWISGISLTVGTSSRKQIKITKLKDPLHRLHPFDSTWQRFMQRVAPFESKNAEEPKVKYTLYVKSEL